MLTPCRPCGRRALLAVQRAYRTGSRNITTTTAATASTTTTGRDYNAAVAALNGLQSNFSIVEALRKAGPTKNSRAIPEMLSWVQRIGHEVGGNTVRCGAVPRMMLVVRSSDCRSSPPNSTPSTPSTSLAPRARAPRRRSSRQY